MDVYTYTHRHVFIDPSFCTGEQRADFRFNCRRKLKKNNHQIRPESLPSISIRNYFFRAPPPLAHPVCHPPFTRRRKTAVPSRQTDAEDARQTTSFHRRAAPAERTELALPTRPTDAAPRAKLYRERALAGLVSRRQPLRQRASTRAEQQVVPPSSQGRDKRQR
ncbi:unnamed protein product [Chondrus crispus]|uniref:Uncharacterized protein n=1 Tax=Chondrus crispus TaxID=2769 RepID=R7QKU1_CHOCR|nr:unnamed protein product [Chondrus crispus]CDF38096.1 unnamed protein product [Chondrus crispus]|eukprot:XP_005717965.1 unnamed protein product [Chondrus crispus]